MLSLLLFVHTRAQFSPFLDVTWPCKKKLYDTTSSGEKKIPALAMELYCMQTLSHL